MKKFFTVFSTIIISLFILAVFGWMAIQIELKNKKFGVLTEPIKFMSSFPDLFKTSIKEVNTLPQTFIPTPKDFKPINKLERDVIVLSSYSENDSLRGVVLRNLKDDSILKKWLIKNRHTEVDRIFHPILLDDGSIVYSFGYNWDGLERIDSTGKVVWQQKGHRFHHGMELDSAGNIWACTKEKAQYKNAKIKYLNSVKYYLDYSITQVDITTGEELFTKSISQILKENNLEYYLFKSHVLRDPLHLNDIQPALKTTKYYDEGDLFISLRTISCILHYRPKTNELVNVIEGPFISQHDVDILNDTMICVFSNNLYPGNLEGTNAPVKKKEKKFNMGNLSYSSIVTYDLRSEKFSVIGDSIFKANKIFTKTEGLQEFLNDETYFIEEQNSGILWLIKDDNVIYKNIFKSQHKNHHHLPNWTRIISHDY